MSEHDKQRIERLEAELADLKERLKTLARVLSHYEFAEPQFNSTDVSVLERLRRLEEQHTDDAQ